MEGKLDELGGDIIIMKDKQESEERKAKEVQKEQANQLARRPSILGRLRSGSVTAVSGEDAAAEALRAVTEQLTIVKTKKNPLVRLKNLLGYCVAAQGPAEVRAFSAQMSNLALTCVLLLYAFSYGNVISQLEVLVLSASILLTTVFTYLNAHKRTLKRCNLALAALVWQMSMDASVLKDAIEEVGKHYHSAGSTKSLTSSDLRQMHAAQGKFWLGHSDGGRVCSTVCTQGRVRAERRRGGEGQADQQDFRVAEEECDEEVLHLRQGERSRSHEKDVARGRGQLGVRQLTSAPILK